MRSTVVNADLQLHLQMQFAVDGAVRDVPTRLPQRVTEQPPQAGVVAFVHVDQRAQTQRLVAE